MKKDLLFLMKSDSGKQHYLLQLTHIFHVEPRLLSCGIVCYICELQGHELETGGIFIERIPYWIGLDSLFFIFYQ